MDKKLDVFQKFDDAIWKRMQIVYLDYYGFPVETIQEYVGYAVSTIKTYAKKFAHWIEKAKKLFYHITQNLKQELLAGKQLVYLFKFFDEAHNLVCSKVGTTTQLIEARLKQEMRYYNSHNMPVVSAEICSVIDCGDIPAEGAESFVRSYYIKKFPDKFHKNDRFFGADIPPRTFNKIVKYYLADEFAIAA